MMKTLLIALSLVLLAPPALAANKAAVGVDQAVSASNTLGAKLFGQLSAANQGNLVLSPFSISSALAMLTAGAAGKTETELLRGFGLKASDSSFPAAFGLLSKRVRLPGFATANRLWVDQKFELLSDFAQFTEGHYGAAIERLDFQKGPNPSRQMINQWVEDKTKGHIRDLLPPDSITTGTRMVLTNAVYFKGIWKRAFKKEKTDEAEFHPLKGPKSIPVSMMQQKARFDYYDGSDFQGLILPYKDSDLVALVLLPKNKSARALSSLNKLLSAQTLKRFLDSEFQSSEVQVSLPRFSFTVPTDLNSLLAHAGITKAFKPDADFSGISEQKDLRVSKAIHKAFIEVNEEGTEAAAATGIILDITAMPNAGPAIFRADHPFLFVVLDRASGLILFTARVMNPLEK